LHELSVAQGIIDAVIFEAEKNNAKHVQEINVDVGELMQLDTRLLGESIKGLLTGPKLTGAKIGLKVEDAFFECRKCSENWDMTEARKQLAGAPDNLLIREPDTKELPLHFLPYLYPAFIRCPKCGSTDVAVLKGEDIRLRKLIMD